MSDQEYHVEVASPSWTPEIIIGSGQGCDIHVASDIVSGRHCGVARHPLGYTIKDLASKNGVYVDGARIKGEAVVTPLAVVTLGRSVQFPWNEVLRHFSSVAGSAPVSLQTIYSRSRDGYNDDTVFGQEELNPVAVINLAVDDGSFVLGRGSDCDIRIDHPMVSKRHARLTVYNGITRIADLGSFNGTFLDGHRIVRPTPLQPGVSVAIGPVVFTVSEDGRRLTPRSRAGSVTLEACGVGVVVGRRKRLLSDVDLVVLPGELVGLMGPSGAGKSTLISALNGYLPPTEGRVTINGRDLYARYDEFRGMIGYVPQDDIMHADLSVTEALYYSARLRLPADHSDSEIRVRIATVLADLGLTESALTRIGNAERRGISGGQRKRVNVAMELLTDPPILFLDEPTSGLSSEDALTLMQLLRRLADTGKTIILTIHQPSLDVFRLMDSLVVVGKDETSSDGGRITYFGPAYPDAITFFETSLGERQEGPPQSADGVLRGLSKRRTTDWVEEYRESQYHALYVRQRQGTAASGEQVPLRRRRAAGGIAQFLTLSRRGVAVKLKDTWNTAILLLQAPLIAMLVGLLFGSKLREHVDEATFGNVAHATATTMFLLGIAAIWFGCSNAAREIVAEIAIYRRERMVGLGIPSYVASKLSVLGLLCIFQCAVLLAVVNTFGQLEAPWATLYTALLVASCVGVTLGLLISALSRSGEVAAAVLPLVILPMVIFGGRLMPLPDFPQDPLPMGIVAQAMPSRWAFESLIVPEAESRPAIDRGAMPPQNPVVPARSHERPRLAAIGDLDDFAEPFFPKKTWRTSPTTIAAVMGVQAALLVGLVGCVLRQRDVS